MRNLHRLVPLVALLACGSPDSQTDVQCGPNGECPKGYECDPKNNRCVKEGTLTVDAALPADAALPDAAPVGCAPPTGGPTTHPYAANISADETWSANGSPHIVQGDVRISGSAILTLEPCAVVQMAPISTITVGLNAATSRMVANGNAAQPVRFVAQNASSPWSFVRVYSPGTASFSYTRFEGGGAADAALSAIGDALPGVRKIVRVDHVTISGSQTYGVHMSRSAGFADGSTDLTITGAGASTATSLPDQPMAIGVQAAGTIPTGSYTGNADDTIIIDGDQTITENLTLADRGVPYSTLFAGDVRVRNATMTLAAGVVVRLRPGQGWSSGATTVPPAGGSLVAMGTAAQPVRFTAQPNQAKWGSIVAQAPGTVSLTNTILEDGGDNAGNSDTTLLVWGDGALPLDPVLFVDHVTIRRSKGAGVRVDRSGAFAAGSTDLTVTASGGANFAAALSVATPAVNTIPPGSYTGNLADEIRLVTNKIIDSETFPNRGVPYSLPSSLDVVPLDAAKVATLTIEPGVTLKFGANAYLRIGITSAAPWVGVLKAIGTADKPIVFTADSPTPTAGFWRGIWFETTDNDQSRIDYARIEYAGANCLCVLWGCPTPNTNNSDNAAVIFNGGRPPSAFITHTTFAHIAGHGVLSAWRSTLEGPDFKTPNTFTDLTGCPQTHWEPMTLADCPADGCY